MIRASGSLAELQLRQTTKSGLLWDDCSPVSPICCFPNKQMECSRS